MSLFTLPSLFLFRSLPLSLSPSLPLSLSQVQKVDMYSLGIILFEMCHTPCTTSMERHKLLAGVRKKEVEFPPGFTTESNREKEVHVHVHTQVARPLIFLLTLLSLRWRLFDGCYLTTLMTAQVPNSCSSLPFSLSKWRTSSWRRF